MKICNKIKDEKIQYDVIRKAAKILALLSEKLISMSVLQVKNTAF